MINSNETIYVEPNWKFLCFIVVVGLCLPFLRHTNLHFFYLDGDTERYTMLCIGICCVLFGLWPVFTRKRIRLDRDSLILVNGHAIPWTDIDGFQTQKINF